MVLKQSNKSILCGGTLIGANIVLTSASCRDSEPLKYQTRTVYKIVLHPKYQKTTLDNDLAVIVTENEFQIDGQNDHISPLCIEFGNLSSLERCVTLGWGNEAIKYHITDSIMHYANTTELDLGYTLHPVNHCAKIDLDPSLVDMGSGLACTVDDIHYHLKGVFTKVRSDGYLEFTRPDMEWISYLFSGNI
uniref:Peptidase S1 domain-containing protein n=1 Tax=Megaselia scalaris TaxID=36166 RepID=T1GI26_MEGSC